MSEQSIAEFVARHEQDAAESNPFELENPYMLELNLDGCVRAKIGTMIAHMGDVAFTREKMLEHGMKKLFKRIGSGEVASMMKVEGKGLVYLADQGKRIQILRLNGETLFVNGNDLLAMEDTLDWDVTMLPGWSGVLTENLFALRITGKGMIAITTHYDPLVLKVSPKQPLFTDPNATVAWSGSLQPEIVTNITVRTLIGRGSGEAIQYEFKGEGWVVIQPYEEVSVASSS